MSIRFCLKEPAKDTPCLLDTLQQMVDFATQTLDVFHLMKPGIMTGSYAHCQNYASELTVTISRYI